jgi:hypothetical protein
LAISHLKLQTKSSLLLKDFMNTHCIILYHSVNMMYENYFRKFGGRRINPPANMPYTRPTTDIAKEGLFNILQNRIHIEDIKTLIFLAVQEV